MTGMVHVLITSLISIFVLQLMSGQIQKRCFTLFGYRHKGCWGTCLQMLDNTLMNLHRTQLWGRRQKAAQSLPELGHDVRRLRNLAYSTAPNDVKEILAIEQFVDGLASTDMRLCIKQARSLNLNDAVRHAVELETFNKAELKRDDGRGYLRTTSQTNETQECDTQTLTLIKNIQTMLSEL